MVVPLAGILAPAKAITINNLRAVSMSFYSALSALLASQGSSQAKYPEESLALQVLRPFSTSGSYGASVASAVQMNISLKSGDSWVRYSGPTWKGAPSSPRVMAVPGSVASVVEVFRGTFRATAPTAPPHSDAFHATLRTSKVKPREAGPGDSGKWPLRREYSGEISRGIDGRSGFRVGARGTPGRHGSGGDFGSQ